MANCGKFSSDGYLTLSEEIIKKISWRSEGLECVSVELNNRLRWFYFNNNGGGRESAFLTDNDCHPFSHGVVVGVSNGKVVFYDQSLRIVKKTDYVWASNFGDFIQDGVAKVCKGNLEMKWDAEDEHFRFRNGKCGYINWKFKVVVPLKYEYEKTPFPKNS
jgi:hypothetical protein